MRKSIGAGKASDVPLGEPKSCQPCRTMTGTGAHAKKSFFKQGNRAESWQSPLTADCTGLHGNVGRSHSSLKNADFV